ncbi:hypothetical protein KIW84_030265 [Lathyrus oleraceus]|uniref:Uncharacterized protein n=1 Tax=Pisum sativum TaxID=3888 RepID=A0A9D4XMU6_PEA|nr:hypothetical protein KIW84_030265 [Pisum sativum]
MYKDRHNTTTNNSKFSEPVYAEVDDVLESPTVESSQLEGSTKSSNIQLSDTPDHHTSTPVLRMSSRPHVPNRRYMDYLLMTNGGEPEDYAEACQTTDAKVDDVPESPTVESSQLEGSTESSNIQPPDTPDHYTPTPVLRRSSRPHVPNKRYMDHLLMTDGGEPEDYA